MLTSPVWRLLLSQRLRVERETPKRSWTSFLGMPRSKAESTFNLRSFEYAFMDTIFMQVHYLRKPLLELRLGEVRRTLIPSTRLDRARRRGPKLTSAPFPLGSLPTRRRRLSSAPSA